MEEYLKILKVEYPTTPVWIVKLEENPEEISSVALLSPACLFALCIYFVSIDFINFILTFQPTICFKNSRFYSAFFRIQIPMIISSQFWLKDPT